MDFRYKHSRVKQYLKEGRALGIETVINDPRDIGCTARLDISTRSRPKPARSTVVCL